MATRVVTKYAKLAREGKLLDVLPQHRDAMARGARCTECSLYGCGEGPVLGDVVEDAPIAFVGEAPGANEVEQGAVFVGKSGLVLSECVEQGGYSREELTVVNTLLCRPPMELQGYLFQLRRDHKIRTEKYETAKKRGEDVQPPPPLVLPTEACYPRLKNDLDATNARVLVGVGGEGLRAIAKYTNTPYGNTKVPPGTPKLASVKKQQGSPLPLADGRVLMATFHPAFAMRKGSRHYMPTIKEDLVRSCDIARRGRIQWVEPKGILNPTADVAVNYIDMLRESGARVMNDIETDSANPLTCLLRCIGMGAVVNGEERAIVVPFRHTDGRKWWDRDADKARVAKAVQRLLDSSPLGFQNGLFDTLVLLRLRLMLNRLKRWFDTMYAHHDSDHSELPHDLGFIISRFSEAPRHKDDADHKSVDHVSDYTLQLYNLKDTIEQLRLVEPLKQRVIDCDMVEAFRTDSRMLPHIRDMGALGMMIDEGKRREFYTKLTVETNQLREDLRKITGIPDFNPNSFKQVARFLYLDKGLTPPADPDAQKREMESDLIAIPGSWNPWDDDEEEEKSIDGLSTNEPTLIYLLDQGVDKQTEAFINKQLDFRAVAKLKGTYVGLKDDEDKDGNPIIRDVYRERGFLLDEDHGEYNLVQPATAQDLAQLLPIFHASYKGHVTPTGRLASSPNVQNWPTMGLVNMREMVIAPPGHVFVGADYSQIELRLYAIMAGDQVLLDAYAKGMDAHSLNAAYMQAQKPEDIMKWYDRIENAKKYDPVNGSTIRKEWRKKAKTFVYLLTYGGQEDKLFKTMSIARDPDGKRSFPGLRPEDVRHWWKNYHKGHPWLEKWQKRVVNAWRDAGYVATIIDGRKRFFLGGVDATAMPNHTIQGSAASIMNRAFIQVCEEVPYRKWSSLTGCNMQVHDFLNLQVPLKYQKRAEDLLNACMPCEYGGMNFSIEQASGNRWSEV